MADQWTKPYSREYAAFPAAWLRGFKFWPTTGNDYFLNPFTVFKMHIFLTLMFLYFFSILQAVWTMCMVIEILFAPFSRFLKWPKNKQLQLHDSQKDIDDRSSWVSMEQETKPYSVLIWKLYIYINFSFKWSLQLLLLFCETCCFWQPIPYLSLHSDY